MAGDGVRVRIAGPNARARIIRHHYSHIPGRAGDTVYAVLPEGHGEARWLAYVGIGLASNVHGVQEMYGLGEWRGNLEITRVVANPTAPKNTASRAVAAVLHRLGEQGYDWVFSYADTGQGHHGGIYQALNAIYVGLSGGRSGLVLDGVDLHPRSAVARFGTQRKDLHAALGIQTAEGGITAKHTYILPCARDRRVRDAIRRALAGKALPYPKRDAPMG